MPRVESENGGIGARIFETTAGSTVAEEDDTVCIAKKKVVLEKTVVSTVGACCSHGKRVQIWRNH